MTEGLTVAGCNVQRWGVHRTADAVMRPGSARVLIAYADTRGWVGATRPCSARMLTAYADTRNRAGRCTPLHPVPTLFRKE